MMTTLDGIPIPVAVAGPDNGVVVVILGAEQRAPAAYDAVCERLHTASLRTVVIGPDPRLTGKSVIGILDSLGIGWAVVVGDRAGGELAWKLAATRLGRFVGLVAIDRGHPRVADVDGVDPRRRTARPWRSPPPFWSAPRPPGRSPATASASSTPTTGWSICSARRNAQESTAQLAAEIVLRTSSW